MSNASNRESAVDVSVVFPAYNEAAKLETAVKEAAKALEAVAGSYEIVIAEDGSTDGTDEIAAALSVKYPFVKRLHGEKRLGRGTALKNAFKQSSGKILVYMDVDLATSIKQLKSLVNAVSQEGYDFAAGSRLLSESKVERSRRRLVASKTYNSFIRALLGSKIKDHQCGFKAFRREAVLALLDGVRARHWFWDTELLVRASRKGYAIKEIPVDWKAPRETKVRLFKDSFSMAWQAVKLWWRLKRE
ncbi:MAG: glycosyltransferase family 2 protein [Candidatus Bathyarchaeota archaeon]|nr:glycosyltransferase family 2 protein [Candidatus Bathyarchaeota archaeon]